MDRFFECLARLDEAGEAAVHRHGERAPARQQCSPVLTFDQHDDRRGKTREREQPALRTPTRALTGLRHGRRCAPSAEAVRALPFDELDGAAGDRPRHVVHLSPQTHEWRRADVVVRVERDCEAGTPIERAEEDGCGEIVVVAYGGRTRDGNGADTDGEDDGVGATARNIETRDEAGSGHAGATITSPAMQSATRHAPNGMVASVDHLASTAGVSMRQRGGSAADAAIAASAVVAVTCPHLCGMGGDLFALVHDGRAGTTPTALNASGRAGRGADAARLRLDGFTTMPFTGDVRSAPVPGCVDGWLALHERYGRLPLATVLEPAVVYAAN